VAAFCIVIQGEVMVERICIAPRGGSKARHSGMDHTVLPANYTVLAFTS